MLEDVVHGLNAQAGEVAVFAIRTNNDLGMVWEVELFTISLYPIQNVEVTIPVDTHY